MRTLAIFSAPGMASNRCGIALLNRNEETRLPCGRGRALAEGCCASCKAPQRATVRSGGKGTTWVGQVRAPGAEGSAPPRFEPAPMQRA